MKRNNHTFLDTNTSRVFEKHSNNLEIFKKNFFFCFFPPFFFFTLTETIYIWDTYI